MQSLISIGVNFADNLMVGTLGDYAISGVYIGGQLQSVLMMLTGGIEGTVAILSAQYWGRRDTGSIRRIVTIGVWLSLAVGVIAALLCFFMPITLVRLFTIEEAVVAEGSAYLRIIAFSFLFFCISQVMIASMRSVETARVGLYTSLATLCINVTLNYILIFGKLGFPAMGVRGAATATLVSRAAEMTIGVVYVFLIDRKLCMKPRDLLVIDRILSGDFVRCALPIMGGQVVWSCNVLISTGILGVYTAGVMTAVSISGMLGSMAFISMNGLSQAVGVIAGKTIGAGQYEKMKEYARTTQVIMILVGLVSGLLIFLLRDGFISLYHVSDEARFYSRQFINVVAVTTIGTSYQVSCLSGLVKSGGDIAFVFKMDIIFVFFVVLPLGWLFQKLGLEPWLVFFALKCDQIIKCFVALVKINRFNWMKNLTRDAKPQIG